MNIITDELSKVPIKAWNNHVEIEKEAITQAINLSTLPFIHKWVALMPDAHYGMGSTVGSVIATDKAIIPAAVGVDIGCGMCAVKTTLKAEDLPDDLKSIRSQIERDIPVGFNQYNDKNIPKGLNVEKTKKSLMRFLWLINPSTMLCALKLTWLNL